MATTTSPPFRQGVNVKWSVNSLIPVRLAKLVRRRRGEDMSLRAVVVLLILGGLVAAALVSTAGVKRWNITSATTTVDVGAVAASDARDLIRMDTDKG